MKIRKSYLSIALMALTVQTGMAQEQKRDSLDTGKVQGRYMKSEKLWLPAPVMKRMSDICPKPYRW